MIRWPSVSLVYPRKRLWLTCTGRSSALHGQKLYSLRQDELAVDTFLGHVADHTVTGEQLLQLLKTSGAAITDVVVLEIAERDEGLTGFRNRCERRSQHLIAEESVRLTGDEGRLPHVLAVQILELAEGSDGLVVQDELRVLSVGTLQGVYQIDDVVGLDGGLCGYDTCLRTALGSEDAQRLAGAVAVQERVLLSVGQRLAEYCSSGASSWRSTKYHGRSPARCSPQTGLRRIRAFPISLCRRRLHR